MEACSCGIPSWAQGYGIPGSIAAPSFRGDLSFCVGQRIWVSLFDQREQMFYNFHQQTGSALTLLFFSVQKAPPMV